jgi:hypothetical protein
MEKFSWVQRGQNIILTINELKKTKVIVDKVQRDTFIATVKEIIASKKKDDTKEKELLKLVENSNADKKLAKEVIVETAKAIKETKKAKKEVVKTEIKKEVVRDKPVVRKTEPVLMITETELAAIIAAKIDEALNGNYKKEKVVEEKPRTNNRREY